MNLPLPHPLPRSPPLPLRAVMESLLLPKVRAVMERAPPRPRSQRVAHRSQRVAHPATTANGQAVVMIFVRMLQRIGVPIRRLIVLPSALRMVMNYARMPGKSALVLFYDVNSCAPYEVFEI